MARFWTMTTAKLIVVWLSILAAPCLGDQIGVDLAVQWGNPCLQAVISTQGCIEELVASFLSLQPRILGPACCRAATSIDDNCWPKIFPLNPFFPPLIKSFCSGNAQQYAVLPVQPPVVGQPLHP